MFSWFKPPPKPKNNVITKFDDLENKTIKEIEPVVIGSHSFLTIYFTDGSWIAIKNYVAGDFMDQESNSVHIKRWKHIDKNPIKGNTEPEDIIGAIFG